MDGIAVDEELVRPRQTSQSQGHGVLGPGLVLRQGVGVQGMVPLTHRWLGFQEANVNIDPPTIGHTEGTCSTRLMVAGPVIVGEQLTGFNGRWLITDDLVITAIAVSSA